MFFMAMAAETLVGAGFHNEYASNSFMGAAFEGTCLKMPARIGSQTSGTLKTCHT